MKKKTLVQRTKSNRKGNTRSTMNNKAPISPVPPNAEDTEKVLLGLLENTTAINADGLVKLAKSIENHGMLAKIFLLEGTPVVFNKNHMKYIVYREQVASKFSVGSQDICIVGSAKLGFSPSPTAKYGTPFSKTSDVDVVVISEKLFHLGSQEIFNVLSKVTDSYNSSTSGNIPIAASDFEKLKTALRNYRYNNFNPGILPDNNPLRQDIFNKIASTSGLFLALEPKVVVSKIRCRIFKSWKAAEDYYANSLRKLKTDFASENDIEDEIDEGLSGEVAN